MYKFSSVHVGACVQMCLTQNVMHSNAGTYCATKTISKRTKAPKPTVSWTDENPAELTREAHLDHPHQQAGLPANCGTSPALMRAKISFSKTIFPLKVQWNNQSRNTTAEGTEPILAIISSGNLSAVNVFSTAATHSPRPRCSGITRGSARRARPRRSECGTVGEGTQAHATFRQRRNKSHE